MTRTWRRWLAIEALALLVAACGSPSGSPSRSYSDLKDSDFYDIDQYSRRGDSEMALRSYLGLVRSRPEKVELTRIKRYGGDPTQLAENAGMPQRNRARTVANLQIELLRMYVAHRGDEWDAIVKLATNLDFVGQGDEALKMMTAYAAAHPNNAWPHAWMAAKHARDGKYATAVAEIERTTAIQTAEFEALASAGDTAFEIGEKAPKKERKLRRSAAIAGEAALRRAVKIGSYWPQYQMLANVLHQRANLEGGSKAAHLRAEAAGIYEWVKEKRADERADSIAREIRRKTAR
jgi:hypothetical protein